MAGVTVVGLVRYPVKGCAGTALSEALVTPAGLEHDRAFLVTDENGAVRGQEGDPRLAVIRPEVAADGARLTLAAPDVAPVTVEVDTVSAPAGVDHAIDQGERVAAWLSHVLGKPSRLVWVSPDRRKAGFDARRGASAFADSRAVHLLSEATLDTLNERLLERGGVALPMNRFRPNVVVAGWGEPHVEDRIRVLRMGEVELGYSELAIRCAVTTIEQEAGVRSGPEPLRTLASYRRTPEGLALGVKLDVLARGKVSVGDEVRVLSFR